MGIRVTKEDLIERVKNFYKSYSSLKLSEEKINKLAEIFFNAPIYVESDNLEQTNFITNGKVKQNIKKFKDSKDNKSYFSLTNTDIKNFTTLLTSRFYNYLSCQTYNSYFTNKNDNINQKDPSVIVEDLAKMRNATEESKTSENDYINFILDNNDTIKRQYIKRNVFSVLMGENDNHTGNLLLNKDELFHIDLTEVRNKKSKFLFLYMPRYGEFENKFDIDYFLLKQNEKDLQQDAIDYNKDYYAKHIDKIRELFRDLSIADSYEDGDQLKFEKVSTLLEQLKNVNIKQLKPNLEEKEQNKLEIAKETLISMMEKVEDKNITIDKFISDLQSDKNLINHFMEDYNLTKDCIIATIKNVLNLNSDDIDFILLDSPVEKVIIEGNDSFKKCKDDFKESIYKKQIEMFEYARQNKILHNIFDVDKKYENELYKETSTILKILSKNFNDEVSKQQLENSFNNLVKIIPNNTATQLKRNLNTIVNHFNRTAKNENVNINLN